MLSLFIIAAEEEKKSMRKKKYKFGDGEEKREFNENLLRFSRSFSS